VSLLAIELFAERLAAYGLSLIRHNPGITSRPLCSALNLLPPDLVGKISLMEKRDLLQRKTNPDDGRAIGLTLSVAGSQMMPDAKNTATESEQEVSSKLTGAEAKNSLRLLQNVYF